MEFDLPRTVGLLVAIVGLGVGGLVAGDMMPLRIVMMMVLPSMAVFAAVVFVLGVKHGEYRASR